MQERTQNVTNEIPISADLHAIIMECEIAAREANDRYNLVMRTALASLGVPLEALNAPIKLREQSLVVQVPAVPPALPSVSPHSENGNRLEGALSGDGQVPSDAEP